MSEITPIRPSEPDPLAHVCANCRAFRPDLSKATGKRLPRGQCRLNPPFADDGGMASWPVVMASDDCEAFAPRPWTPPGAAA